ncbi:MAG: AsnC family transcriptional regulator [Nitrospiraceae bacterium]|jgi:DNA-binding Lrp family transcriptional regulator|nr:AsnC family transcriptional regulator [Nitrospiraceae bacterium]
MALGAFILVDVVGDHTRSCQQTLSRITGVQKVYTVCGDHDLIVRVEVETLQELRDETLARIRCVEGITKTTTCLEL